jgi:hypothetical protein
MSAGLTWNLTDKLGFQASYMYDEAAPSLANLGSPMVATYNVSVYDFVKSQTVLATLSPAAIRRWSRNIATISSWG